MSLDIAKLAWAKCIERCPILALTPFWTEFQGRYLAVNQDGHEWRVQVGDIYAEASAPEHVDSMISKLVDLYCHEFWGTTPGGTSLSIGLGERWGFFVDGKYRIHGYRMAGIMHWLTGDGELFGVDRSLDRKLVSTTYPPLPRIPSPGALRACLSRGVAMCGAYPDTVVVSQDRFDGIRDTGEYEERTIWSQRGTQIKTLVLNATWDEAFIMADRYAPPEVTTILTIRNNRLHRPIRLVSMLDPIHVPGFDGLQVHNTLCGFGAVVMIPPYMGGIARTEGQNPERDSQE